MRACVCVCGDEGGLLLCDYLLTQLLCSCRSQERLAGEVIAPHTLRGRIKKLQRNPRLKPPRSVFLETHSLLSTVNPLRCFLHFGSVSKGGIWWKFKVV